MPLPPADENRNLILLMLALCAVLGASTSTITGAATGVVLLLIIIVSALIFMSIRSWLPSALQAAAFVVIFTGCVSAMDLLLRAWWPDLYREVGTFLPLAVAAGPLLASADMLSSDRTKTASLKGIFTAGIICAGAAVLLGGLRELGSGHGDSGFPLALLPPGALIITGLLLAAWNAFAGRARRS